MATKFANILQTIGHTPVVRLNKLAPAHVNLYVKIEAFNPLGSVKDRLALGVIEDAERSGKLKPGQTVLEFTSGNTGIGLAMVCAQKGYPLVIVMGENFSVERRRLMRFLGAKVVLTPAHLRGSGSMVKAVELAEKHGWFLCRQFENEANAEMHSRTTAQEILADFAGERLDFFVTGYGTGGTLKGVGRVLRERSPQTQIIVCEADNSPVLTSGIPNPPTGSHPMSRPHPVQGWGPDFIPKLTEDAVAMKLFDRIVTINGGDALRLSRELAQKEGIFVGISSGGTLAAALKISESAPAGSNVLCMLPDTGERYLTTPLFADIGADMNEAELDIMRSTPSAQFGEAAHTPAPAPAAASAPAVAAPVCGLKPPSASAAAPVISAEAETFVREILSDPKQPVVLFAQEWCEFSWAVRNLFKAYQVPFRSVDLDSVPYQKDERGAKIRAVASARSGFTTIPQVFIGGAFIGGATETLNAWKVGTLQPLLEKHGVLYDKSITLDPLSLMPGWLHGS